MNRRFSGQILSEFNWTVALVALAVSAAAFGAYVWFQPGGQQSLAQFGSAITKAASVARYGGATISISEAAGVTTVATTDANGRAVDADTIDGSLRFNGATDDLASPITINAGTNGEAVADGYGSTIAVTEGNGSRGTLHFMPLRFTVP